MYPYANTFYIFMANKQGGLCDGFKIVIFSATFAESSKSKDGSVLNLSINGVRIARGDASLGYVHPRFLHRGLSIKSLVVWGGAVFSVGVTVIRRSAIIHRLRVRRGRSTSSKSSSSDEPGQCNYILSTREREAYMSMLKAKESSLAANSGKHSLLNIHSLVAGLKCDTWIKNIITVKFYHRLSCSVIAYLHLIYLLAFMYIEILRTRRELLRRSRCRSGRTSAPRDGSRAKEARGGPRRNHQEPKRF